MIGFTAVEIVQFEEELCWEKNQRFMTLLIVIPSEVWEFRRQNRE